MTISILLNITRLSILWMEQWSKLIKGSQIPKTPHENSVSFEQLDLESIIGLEGKSNLSDFIYLDAERNIEVAKVASDNPVHSLDRNQNRYLRRLEKIRPSHRRNPNNLNLLSRGRLILPELIRPLQSPVYTLPTQLQLDTEHVNKLDNTGHT